MPGRERRPLSPVRALKVGVVGCGVAGQAVAALLAEAGHAVTVFERFAEPRPIGAGLLLQPTGLAVLAALGLGEAALAGGGKVAGLEAKTAGGRTVLDLRYADLHPAAHGLGIRRSLLFDLLHHRLKGTPARLLTGRTITAIEQGGVIDERGDREGPFDLVIVADGAHSALRARLMPQARAPLYPWGCIWTTVHDSAGLGAAGLLRQRVRGTTEMIGFLPVGGDRLTMYWSQPAAALANGRPLDLEAMRRTARVVWPDAAGIVDAAVGANDFARATYRHVALPRWNDGAVLFIGDAAHGTSPQLGQGANLGLLDAWALAQVLGETSDLATALATFARRRDSAVRFYRQASHLLTPFFQSQAAPLGWLRDGFMGLACRLPVLRPLAASTLAGLRRGWLSADTLDENGRYRL